MALVRLYNEKALLQKIADGDPTAFSELYHAFAPSLFKAIMAYTKDEHLAEEVLQMVFIKIWEKRQMATDRNGYLPDRGKFGEYHLLSHVGKILRRG